MSDRTMANGDQNDDKEKPDKIELPVESLNSHAAKNLIQDAGSVAIPENLKNSDAKRIEKTARPKIISVENLDDTKKFIITKELVLLKNPSVGSLSEKNCSEINTSFSTLKESRIFGSDLSNSNLAINNCNGEERKDSIVPSEACLHAKQSINKENEDVNLVETPNFVLVSPQHLKSLSTKTKLERQDHHSTPIKTAGASSNKPCIFEDLNVSEIFQEQDEVNQSISHQSGDDLPFKFISINSVDETLEKRVPKKKSCEKVCEIFNSLDSEDDISFDNDSCSIDSYDNCTNNSYYPNDNDPEKWKKVLLEAVSFSDTFDIENAEEKEAKIPDDIPFFIDLEPAHFKQAPRFAYCKRKKQTRFDNTSHSFFESDDELDDKKRKSKKRKASKFQRNQDKVMQEWISHLNNTFEEFKDYELVIE